MNVKKKLVKINGNRRDWEKLYICGHLSLICDYLR